jgi:hypothetical protein
LAKASRLAHIEAQTSGGTWIKVSECVNSGPVIKQVFDAHIRAGLYAKFRAVDSVTKALIDLAFKT